LPKRSAVNEVVIEQKCTEIIYRSAWSNGSACGARGKVETAEGWRCGIHSPEAEAKRKAKSRARFDKRNEVWRLEKERTEKGIRYDADMAAKDARIAELEAEVAALKRKMEQALAKAISG
jgi:hypothetical protein